MECPKCRGNLRPVKFQGTEIDRCEKCEGMWFDMGEQQDLKRAEGSEVNDTGTLDAARDAKQRVMCPRDQVQMVRMVDPAKPQIWFESCPLCYGVFLDASEFRELKKDTSFWERLIRRRRPRTL